LGGSADLCFTERVKMSHTLRAVGGTPTGATGTVALPERRTECTDAVGEGADRHMRGRMCSPRQALMSGGIALVWYEKWLD